MMIERLGSFVLLIALAACGDEEFKWAFAQNLDNSFGPNQFCRESLAQSIYAPANKDKTIRQGTANVFLFRGAIESYRIYAFKSQAECETALTNMKLRQRP
jgi:hypothetical protein